MVQSEDILSKYENKRTVKLGDIAKGTANGAAIGTLGGILYAYFNDKQYFPCMIGGLLVGGTISRIFLIRKN